MYPSSILHWIIDEFSRKIGKQAVYAPRPGLCLVDSIQFGLPMLDAFITFIVATVSKIGAVPYVNHNFSLARGIPNSGTEGTR